MEGVCPQPVVVSEVRDLLSIHHHASVYMRRSNTTDYQTKVVKLSV